jgi:hypothetical protein
MLELKPKITLAQSRRIVISYHNLIVLLLLLPVEPKSSGEVPGFATATRGPVDGLLGFTPFLEDFCPKFKERGVLGGHILKLCCKSRISRHSKTFSETLTFELSKLIFEVLCFSSLRRLALGSGLVGRWNGD